MLPPTETTVQYSHACTLDALRVGTRRTRRPHHHHHAHLNARDRYITAPITKLSGDNLVNSCSGDLIQACANGCQSGACYIVPSPSATLKAIPMLVNTGNTTVVSWAGANVRSCTVHGTNGDSWTGVSSFGETSSPIQGQTIYTLHCAAFPGAIPSSVDKSVTVNFIPSFNEK